MKEVRIGDRNVTIPRFSAFKIVRAGRLIAKISKAYPTIMFDVARFERDFEASNKVQITRAMAKMPKFAALDLDDEDFQGKDFVEFPSSPNDYQRFASVFPAIMDVAEEDVVKLIALVLAPNKVLEEQDEDDTVDEYLRAEGKKLLHEAEGDQLIDVCISVAEVLKEQFAEKVSDAGKAFMALRENGTPTTNSPESSIGSDVPTDGTEAESSTVLSGAN